MADHLGTCYRTRYSLAGADEYDVRDGMNGYWLPQVLADAAERRARPDVEEVWVEREEWTAYWDCCGHRIGACECDGRTCCIGPETTSRAIRVGEMP